ncbi:MAG: TlpA family protein disulfide reductase [Planctomycetes bacterium]|nr:TlpA family protein disulfide reductase [Planctomycetota bacterium]
MRSFSRRVSLFLPIVVATSVGAQPDSDSTGPVNRQAARQAGSTGVTGPQDLSEEALARRVRGFEKMLDARQGGARQAGLRIMLWEEAITHVNVLLARFANSRFTEQVTATKLKALAELARSDQDRLDELLELTAEINRGNPGPRLASENAFYAIQGFVLGARLEKIPARRRLAGTVERYEAFLTDHPTSGRAPVIQASLIRNLIALDQVDRARRVLALLQRDHPGHRATLRATGELYRMDAIGKPFVFDYTTNDGKTIRAQDYLGKVLVIHFWATWSSASRNDLLRLIELHRKHKDSGLQLVGVNLDKSHDQIGKALDTFNMSWPQYFDEKGLDNDALASMGVVSVPVYFVADRRGILRSITRGDNLPELIESLLAKPAEKG